PGAAVAFSCDAPAGVTAAAPSVSLRSHPGGRGGLDMSLRSPEASSRHASRIAALSLALAPSCASIVSGRFQQIPIDSQPDGARVTVSRPGVARPYAIGVTPMVLRVGRKEEGLVVRVEADGRDAVDVPLRRAVNGWIAGDVVWAANGALSL